MAEVFSFFFFQRRERLRDVSLDKSTAPSSPYFPLQPTLSLHCFISPLPCWQGSAKIRHPGLVLWHSLILGLAVLALATVDAVNPNLLAVTKH